MPDTDTLQCEAPVGYISWGSHNSNFTVVYGTYNELVTGAFVNQLRYLGGLTLYDYYIYVHIMMIIFLIIPLLITINMGSTIIWVDYHYFPNYKTIINY